MRECLNSIDEHLASGDIKPVPRLMEQIAADSEGYVSRASEKRQKQLYPVVLRLNEVATSTALAERSGNIEQLRSYADLARRLCSTQFAHVH